MICVHRWAFVHYIWLLKDIYQSLLYNCLTALEFSQWFNATYHQSPLFIPKCSHRSRCPGPLSWIRSIRWRSTCGCSVWLERLMTPEIKAQGEGGLGGSLGVIVEIVIACATTLGLTTALWVSESTSRSRDERIVHGQDGYLGYALGGKVLGEAVFVCGWRVVARED